MRKAKEDPAEIQAIRAAVVRDRGAVARHASTCRWRGQSWSVADESRVARIPDRSRSQDEWDAIAAQRFPGR